MRDNKPEFSIGKAYVTFDTKRMADAMEDVWGAKSGYTLLKFFKKVAGKNYHYQYTKDNKNHSNTLKIRRSSDPNDIIWQHLGTPFKEAFLRRFITYLCTFFLLCLSFGAILGLKIAQNILYKNASIEDIGLRFISILIATVIAGINFVLSITIKALTHAEKHQTETSYFQFLMIKTVIAQIVNTNLLVIIAHVIVYKPRIAVYGRGALMTDAWFILLYQAIIVPLIVSFFDLKYIWGVLNRWWLRRKMQKHSMRVTTTQEEAHHLFEKASFDTSLAYTNFTMLFMTMVFFQPILPMGAVTGSIGLILIYFSYKKKLVKDSKRPVMVTKDIAQITLYLLSLTPLIYGVSLADLDIICHLR
jgi:hypothetical protein